MHQADLALDARALLGEGPLWSDNGLYWVDIDRPQLELLDHHGIRHYLPRPVEEPVSSVALTDDGRLLVSFQDSLWLMEADGSRPELHLTLPIDADLRLNDSAVDPLGGYWVGSMHEDDLGRGELFHITTHCQSVLSGVSISNGIDWSLDGETMYYVDSPTRRIDAFHFEAGAISERRQFAALPGDNGFPDGLTVDAEGNVWVAIWGGWAVWVFDPAGINVDRVAVPCSQVTSCTFGGPDLDRLYITTARIRLSDEQLTQEPLAGGIFVCEPRVTGRQSNRLVLERGLR